MKQSLRHNIILSGAFSCLYIALYYVSELITGTEGIRGVASLFFLPAFIRLFAFLVVEYWAIPALFIAGLFCVDLGLGLAGKAVVSAFIAVGGPLGVFIVSKLCGLRPSLTNLTPLRLLWLSAGCAAGNAIFYDLGMLAVGAVESDLSLQLTIFAGDMIGTWVVMYCINMAMNVYSKINFSR